MRHKISYPLVSGSRDSRVGIVSVDEVERSPIFALTEILPVEAFLLSRVCFELFSFGIIAASLRLPFSISECFESTDPTLSDDESSSPSASFVSIGCCSVPFSSAASFADEACAAGSKGYMKNIKEKYAISR